MRDLILLVSLFVYFPTAAQEIGTIEWTNGFIEDSYIQNAPRVDLGFITVPENYLEDDGTRLQVAFAIVKAQSVDVLPDPVIIFHGGWGATILDDLEHYLDHFLGHKRDLILLDYRGSGYSEPQLCNWLGKEVLDNFLKSQTYTELEKTQISLFNQCLDSLERQKIDFNQYHSYNKARDIALLADRLGYESYNLFAVSYGTRTAQCFMALDKVPIRAAILDSPCPVGFPVTASFQRDFARSLELVFEDCANNPECEQAFPDLKERYYQFLKELDKKEVKVKLPKDRILYVNREKFNAVLHQLLYNENHLANLPFLLDKIFKGKWAYLRYLVQDTEQLVLTNFNGLGLINYVYDHKVFQAKAKAMYESDQDNLAAYHILDGYRAFYLQDQRIKNDLKESVPIKSDVPSMILSGEYDPITPPYFAEFLKPQFSNHQFFLFPKVGHAVSENDCGAKLVKEFIQDLDNLSHFPCLKEVRNKQINFHKTN